MKEETGKIEVSFITRRKEKKSDRQTENKKKREQTKEAEE